MEWCEGSLWTCPACRHVYRQHAYFEMGVGSMDECPKCHAVIVVEDTETIARFGLRCTRSDPEARG